MLPLLSFASDGKEHRFREAVEALADHFSLSEDERRELLPSGRYPLFDNRVGWANTYMKKAGLIEGPRRGYLKITPRGSSVLEEQPNKINSEYLRRYREFTDFQNKGSGASEPLPQVSVKDEDEQTPIEMIEAAYGTVRNNLATELLQQIKSCSPGFFEALVVEVLVKMGYGGTIKDAGEVLGKSGDEGIDGVINEDRLGLDKIYIQAKRWEGTISRPEIQKFVGALLGKQARKGIFITTSKFSKHARDYADAIESSVVLVDGEMLAGFMIDHDVGVTLETAYEVKRIDSDYFEGV